MIFIILTLLKEGHDRLSEIILLDSKTLERITDIEFDLKSVRTHRSKAYWDSKLEISRDTFSMKGDPQLVPNSDN